MDTHQGQPKRAIDHTAQIRQFYRELFAKAGQGEPAPPTRPASRPHAPANPEEISTEEFYRQIFAQARQRKSEGPAPEQPARPALNPDQFTAMSTEDFYRELFAQAGSPAPAVPTRPAPAAKPDEPQSLEDFYRELFAKPEKSLKLGPRPGLEPPALPARFKRLRGGNTLVFYELLVAEDGRIAAKHENVAGVETYFIYEYDESGHLLRAWRDGALAEEYAYDGRGARVASWNPKDGQWKYCYDSAGKLAAAGPWQFSYAGDGALREAWTPQAAYFLSCDRAGGMSRVVLPRNRVLRYETIAPGLPVEKYIDARPVESLTWRSPLQLATYRDHRSDTLMQFHYTGQGRLPSAVTVQTAKGTTNYLLGYDQVGSLKAVAAMDGESEGRVVKVLDYDSFGNVLADSNPNLFLPLAFAGGLRDRFTGLVRFLIRDYDPAVGRFTAPDPLGDTGGDHDLYDYCVDEPVGRVDPEGTLFSELWSLLGFADENKKQEKREETSRNAWKEAKEAEESGDVGKAVDIYESMPDILTNSTVGGGGKVGAAGIRVILKSKPWGKATPSR
jgi:RHS repeat-associated protein